MDTACGFCSKSLEGLKRTERPFVSTGDFDRDTMLLRIRRDMPEYSVKCPNCGEYWRVYTKVEMAKVADSTGLFDFVPQLREVSEPRGKLPERIWKD